MTTPQIETAVYPEPLDPALGVGHHLPSVALRPPVPDRQQVLPPGLDPLHRPPGLPGGDDREVLLLGEVELAPEAASDERGDHPHRGLGQAEGLRELLLHQVGCLTGEMDRQTALLPLGEDRPSAPSAPAPPGDGRPARRDGSRLREPRTGRGRPEPGRRPHWTPVRREGGRRRWRRRHRRPLEAGRSRRTPGPPRHGPAAAVSATTAATGSPGIRTVPCTSGITTRDVSLGIGGRGHLDVGHLVRGDHEENAFGLESRLDIDRDRHRAWAKGLRTMARWRVPAGVMSSTIAGGAGDECRVLATLNGRADERGYEGFGGHRWQPTGAGNRLLFEQ